MLEAPLILPRLVCTLNSTEAGFAAGVTLTVSVSVTVPPPAPCATVGWLSVALTVGPAALSVVAPAADVQAVGV